MFHLNPYARKVGGIVSDVYGRLDVCFENAGLWLKRGAKEIPWTQERRVYDAVLMYRKSPQRRELRLIDFKLYGPPAPQAQPLEERLMATSVA